MAAAKEAAKAVRTGVLDMDAHVTKAWEFFRRMGSPKFHVAVRPQPHVASGGAPRLQQATRRSLRRVDAPYAHRFRPPPHVRRAGAKRHGSHPQPAAADG